jgi:hypothetical protein
MVTNSIRKDKDRKAKWALEVGDEKFVKRSERRRRWLIPFLAFLRTNSCRQTWPNVQSTVQIANQQN